MGFVACVLLSEHTTVADKGRTHDARSAQCVVQSYRYFGYFLEPRRPRRGFLADRAEGGAAPVYRLLGLRIGGME